MSYNLQTLITVLQQILNPEQKHWILDDHSKSQLESLLQKTASLMQILENSSLPKLESLESRIRDAAHKPEDLIESHVTDQMRTHNVFRSFFSMLSHICVRHTIFTQDQILSHEGTTFTLVTPDLQEVTQELDSAMEKVVELMAAHKPEDLIEFLMVNQMLWLKAAKELAASVKALEVKKEMMMSIGSSSSDPAPTVMHTDDDLQQVEQVLSESKKFLLQHIEEYMMLSGSSSSELEIHQGTGFTFVTPDLQKVTQELDSAIEQVVKLMAEHKISSTVTSSADHPLSGGASSSADHPLSGGASSSADPLSSKSFVVGIDEDLFQLKDRLTRMSEQLEIVPIVGMGGIGKTTLAQKLYDDRHIVSRFDVRAWTTISQDYNVRAILLGLLRDPNGKPSKELIECEDNEHLKTILYQRLFRRRYMIVLDDIWSTQCWDDIKWCFPDNNNGSRIVLTTRELDVARCVGTADWQHEVRLLKESQSWNLLQQTVFGEEDCPYALEEIGRKIARDCGGLPLAITVIGGVLSKAKRARDVWEHLAKDVRATIVETENHEFSNVLSLSYNHLPNNLKPCFLYMAAFPEYCWIKSSRLIRMLVAEGFLKSNGDKSLEEEAEDSLSALVERNLLLVTRKKPNGKACTYGMHDLMREVCIRKANEERFLDHVKSGSEVRLDKLRRVSVETSCGMKDVHAYSSVARSFICAAPNPMLCEERSLLFSKLRLVRVLDVYEMEFPEFPREIYGLVNLRYLAVSCKSGGIPTGISTVLSANLDCSGRYILCAV